MASGITLTASMRNNLLALQNTQKLFDATQERLSTGKKVNSALDNATSYFTSQSLTKRADALSGLLDSMGQAVQTIKAADESLSTLQALVDQGNALVTSALDTSNAKAYITGNVRLDLSSDLGAIGGISDTDTFVIRKGPGDVLESSMSMTANQTLDTIGVPATADGMTLRLADRDGNFQEVQIDIAAAANATTSIQSIMDQINDGFGLDNQGNQKVTASLVEGRLTIRSNDPNNALIALDGTTTTAAGTLASSLGLDTGFEVSLDAVGGTAELGEYISVSAGAAAVTESSQAGVAGEFEFTIDGTSHKVSFAATDSLNALIKNINSQHGGAVRAEFSSTGNGGIRLTAIDPNHTIGIVATGNDAFATGGLAVGATPTPSDVANTFDLMNRINGMDGITASLTDAGRLQITAADGSNITITDISGNAAVALGIQGVATNGTETRGVYAEQFDEVLSQINQLVGNNDTSYKGVNLLNGDSLTVNFNESRTSQLQITGQVMNTKNLGLKTSQNSWTETVDIERAQEQIDAATKKVEAFASELGQNLSIVQTRQDFTENMVNILQTGSDNLTLADMNEEAANMLALQVRQQLATNALSLSSQSQQSVLSLF